jgi:hypothetical protein
MHVQRYSRTIHFSPLAPPTRELESLFRELPEPELWQLLQDLVDREIALSDDAVRGLDPRMQGFLFLQDFVDNRMVRIEFARSGAHMSYLRDAAGSRNVWMDDDEFSSLVEQDDPVALACFARSEKMQPHHLLYIEHKLAMQPHRDEMLATSWDTGITLKKALEVQGNTPSLALIRLARAALHGSAEIDSVLEQRAPGAVVAVTGDAKALWRAFRNLQRLDEGALRELLEAAGRSTGRPAATSGEGGVSLH